MGLLADIRVTYDASLHQRFRAEQYFNCMICFGRNFICIHKIFYIIQQLYKEELCARFWVKGFKVKVDEDKSSLYLKKASSLVPTNSWLQEAGDMILGLGDHFGIWAAQALPLGAAFPPLHPCWKAGQLALFSRESEFWIFFVQSTDFNVRN